MDSATCLVVFCPVTTTKETVIVTVQLSDVENRYLEMENVTQVVINLSAASIKVIVEFVLRAARLLYWPIRCVTYLARCHYATWTMATAQSVLLVAIQNPCWGMVFANPLVTIWLAHLTQEIVGSAQ